MHTCVHMRVPAGLACRGVHTMIMSASVMPLQTGNFFFRSATAFCALVVAGLTLPHCSGYTAHGSNCVLPLALRAAAGNGQRSRGGGYQHMRLSKERGARGSSRHRASSLCCRNGQDHVPWQQCSRMHAGVKQTRCQCCHCARPAWLHITAHVHAPSPSLGVTRVGSIVRAGVVEGETAGQRGACMHACRWPPGSRVVMNHGPGAERAACAHVHASTGPPPLCSRSGVMMLPHCMQPPVDNTR